MVARFVARSPLWLDEALSVDIAGLPLGQITGALRRDGHPPLYYWLLHGWMQLFGSSDVSVRALSGVLAVLALPVAALSARRLARHSSLFAVVLLASSPFAVRYATEARMYALVMLLVLVGVLLVPAALERPTPPRLVAIAVVTALLLYSHYWSMYLVAVVALALLWRLRRSDGRANRVRVLVAVAVGGLAFLAWLPILLSQTADNGTPWAPPARPAVVVGWTLRDIGGPIDDGSALGLAIVVLAVFGAFTAARRDWRVELDFRARRPAGTAAGAAAATMALGTVVAFVARSAYQTRYAAVVVPLVLLVAAAGIAALAPRSLRAAATVVAVVLALPGLVANTVKDRTQGGEIVQRLNAAAAPHDVVVYCPDQLGPAFSRHLRVDLDTLTYPTRQSPSFIDWRHYAARNAAADPEAFAADVVRPLPPHATVWMVWAGGYRTYGDQCERLDAALRTALPDGGPVVAARPGVFEHAALVDYRAGG